MLQPCEKKAPKVLMIARAFPPFLPVGHSIRVIKFIKYLPALGYEPVVLTVDDMQEYETLPKVGSEVLLSEIQPNTSIHRTRTGEPSVEYLQKENALSKKNRLTWLLVKIFGGSRRWIFRNLLLPDRTLVWLPFAVRRGRRIVTEQGIDVIFATCPPHTSTLIGAILKTLTGKPLILDFRDDWIDTPWHLSKPGIIQKIDRVLEKWVVRTADKVILVTEWSRRAFRDRYPKLPRNKFVLITNGCDLNQIKKLSSTSAPFRNSQFTILHAGSLNVSTVWGRTPNGLFKAIRNLLKIEPELAENLCLTFAGDLPDEFKRLADEMGISKVIQGIGHVPHDEVLRLTKSADLLLAINYEGWATLIPGKIYEYWAVGGSPILLLSCPGAAADFVKQHSLGFAVESYDADGISCILLDVYQQWKKGTPLKINPNGIEAFDRKPLTVQLAQVLSSVLLEDQKMTGVSPVHP
ncbi:glycosyltransferase family 4 protein [Chloroflexota bacterium]